MSEKIVSKYLRPLFGALCRRIYQAGQRFEEEHYPAFMNRPRNLAIKLPRRISGAQYIQIGDDVTFGPGCLLTAIDRYPPARFQDRARPRPEQTFSPRLVIGSRVTATSNLTIAAHREVIVEDDVLFASNINITDGFHGFANADEPFKFQPIFRIASIRIGRGSWIGQNVVIMPGVTIGDFAIVGANSVVTRSLPPRCIAMGAPARIVKRWREEERRWVSATESEVAAVPRRAQP